MISASVQAQTKPKKAKKKQTVHSKNVSQNKPIVNQSNNATNTVTLITTTSNPAKANTNTLSVLKNNYAVTDPIITTLDARANGANIRFNKSGIIGMPKRAYGFANGHILLQEQLHQVHKQVVVP